MEVENCEYAHAYREERCSRDSLAAAAAQTRHQ